MWVFGAAAACAACERRAERCCSLRVAESEREAASEESVCLGLFRSFSANESSPASSRQRSGKAVPPGEETES
ncbi:Ovarian Cancer G-Protein Coupled Receptor 1 [Manis pentadactyla]|nr:Ovarian Cancer G-Protein Coupled Receptor 1 [Manis pentadactyla]